MRIIRIAIRFERGVLRRQMNNPATMNERLVMALIGSAQKLVSKRSQ